MHITSPHRLALALALALVLPACAVADGDAGTTSGEPRPPAATTSGVPSPEVLATLALVNDPGVGESELDIDAALDRRAAENIIAHRDGPDAAAGTADDDLFETLAELDDIKYVGPYALEQLRDYAADQGYLDDVLAVTSDVLFSPQPYQASHNVRVAALIDQAQETVDVAMYSFSDVGIASALERAVDRGVEVRFLFDTASADRKKTGQALMSSRSGRLEAIGVDVRWVNKVMHHKLAIIDGPRDDLSRADSAMIVTGSGNWSWGAATRYDENTLFLSGHPELALRLQREFDLLWEHSRDLVADPSLVQILAAADITATDIDDRPDSHAHFTTENYSVSGATFRVSDYNNVANAIAAAISEATESVWVASGHLRSRPVAEALMNARAANPDLDIRVYLDGQEYISAYYHAEQVADRDECLDEATTDGQRRKCTDRGFHFGYPVGESGIPVRYKYYSYRWHYSYAVQMHHKYLLIDGDELWTGSYNLSDNAEHQTFENMLVFRAPLHSELIAAFRDNFLAIWETGRSTDRYDDLLDEVATADPVPLVFDPMALDWDEIAALKAAVRANCTQINSTDYRRHPESHRDCPR